MLKFILFALLLVQISIQIEIVSDEDQESSRHIEQKKYYKNKEWKEDKRYKSEDGWKKHDYESSGKKGQYGGDKKPNYEKERRSVEGEESKRKEMMETVNLSNDINVNKKNTPMTVKDPDSEYFPKRPPTILNINSPPGPNNTVLMARYIIHSVDWAAMATMTTRSGPKHSPFANIVAMSDGPVDQGSGVPFFYITPLDLSTQDIIAMNKASITVTLAQTDYCRKQELDAQDPRCARLILSGKVKRVKPGAAEEAFAEKALFSRHPVMKKWPKDHGFYMAKLKIAQIILLDHFGGATYVDVEQYLHPQPEV